MDEKKVSTDKRQRKAFNKAAVTVRHSSTKRSRGRMLGLRVIAAREHYAVGEKSVEAAHLLPFGEYRWITQKLHRALFVIALEKQHIVLSLACYQQVDDLPRARSAVDVVAEENLDRVGSRSHLKIVVDSHEKIGQKIGAPMYVSDGINAPTGRDAWLFRLV
jgi:hypothetical protein